MKQSGKRAFGRRCSSIHALIETRVHGRIACTIDNVSECGALLVTNHADLLPKRFLLNADDAGFKTGCEVVQRQGTSVGVLFISPDLVSSSDPIWSIDDIISGEVVRQRIDVHECIKTAELEDAD